jgi:hypothetical protein
MVGSRQRNRQLAVFLGGLALLNFPVLAVVDAIRLPSGAPLTPLYVFVVWLGLILFSAVLAVRRPKSG